MLLAPRRRALLTFFLAGMQMAWFTPFVILFLPAAWHLPVLVPFAALFAILVLWLLLFEVLNRLKVASPQYELSVVALLVLSTLVFDRLLVYGGRSLADMTWLGSTVRAVFDLSAGAGQVLVVILTNVILWQRAANFTSSEPTFFGVGLSFRLGLLLFLFGSVLLQAFAHVNALPLLWVFFVCGLTAVSMARIDDKATDAQSAGASLPVSRLGQVLLSVGLTVGAAALVARLLTRQSMIAMVVWLGPLWRVLGFVLQILITIVWWLITPLLVALELLIRRLAESGALSGLGQLAQALQNQSQLAAEASQQSASRVPPWVWAGARYVAISLALLLLIGFVLLFVQRLAGIHGRYETEDEAAEQATLGGGILANAADRLRELAGLARRYGVSRQLLAAVSVQNIYANVARLARVRGYPRRLAQPPDAYLPALRQAFPGQESELARITVAYMRVHYGDRPVSLNELAALRADYQRIRHARKAATITVKAEG